MRFDVGNMTYLYICILHYMYINRNGITWHRNIIRASLDVDEIQAFTQPESRGHNFLADIWPIETATTHHIEGSVCVRIMYANNSFVTQRQFEPYICDIVQSNPPNTNTKTYPQEYTTKTHTHTIDDATIRGGHVKALIHGLCVHQTCNNIDIYETTVQITGMFYTYREPTKMMGVGHYTYKNRMRTLFTAKRTTFFVAPGISQTA